MMIGICTHLGCIPKGHSVGDYKGEYEGWFCPCHGSEYDTAGRVREGPAPQNMAIPPYAFFPTPRSKDRLATVMANPSTYERRCIEVGPRAAANSAADA